MMNQPEEGNSNDAGYAPKNAEYRPAGLALIICFGLTLLCTLIGGDAYYHLDDVTHYLYAAWSWRWPTYLLDDWGRPGFTVLYATVAPLGWMAAKMLSTVLATIAAWLAYLVAKRIGFDRAWLVIPLVFAQPVYFLLAQTTLTETPLAFYLIVAVFFAQRRHWSIALLILSLSFITRHEAIIFAPVFTFFAWRDRQPLWKFLLIATGPLVVNLACWIFDQPIPILKYLEPQPTRQYGHGGWLTYFQRSLHAWGPTVAVLAMLGTPRLCRSLAPAARLVAWSALAYFVAQVIVFRFGLFASGGYSRFLIGISPLIAITAVSGIEDLLAPERHRWVRAGIAAAIALLFLWLSLERQLVLQGGQDIELPELHDAIWAIRIVAWALGILALLMLWLSRRDHQHPIARLVIPSGLLLILGLTVYALHRPLRTKPDAQLIKQALVELDNLGYDDREIISAHPFIDLCTGRALPAGRPTTAGLIEAAPIGALVAWERQFAGGEDHGLALELFSTSPAFQQVLVTSPLPYRHVPYLYVFEKRDAWSAPRESRQ